MKAVTVAPGIAGSVRLEEVAEPDAALGSVVVEALAVGICGTDAEIASGGYGWASPGRDRLILGVLLEPATVVAKAWEHIAAIGRRTFWDPHTVLVVGAGPIGLLAALVGLQQGADVHIPGRVTSGRVTSGPKPALVKQLGATYHQAQQALQRAPDDIKVVMEFAQP